MYWLERLGDIQIPRWNREHAGATGEVPDNYLELPGGAWDGYGNEIANPQVTTISHKSWIWDNSIENIKQWEQRLLALRGKKEKLYRRWSDGRVEWIWVRVHKVDPGQKTAQALQVPLDLTLKTTASYWNTQHHGPARTLNSGYYLDMGYMLNENDSYTITGNSGLIPLTNNHLGSVLNTILTITPQGTGTATLVQAGVLATGCSWSYSGNLAAGDTLIIDCGIEDIYFNGVGDYDHHSLDPDHTNKHWLELLPGLNNLGIAWTGNLQSLKVAIEYWEQAF